MISCILSYVLKNISLKVCGDCTGLSSRIMGHRINNILNSKFCTNQNCDYLEKVSQGIYMLLIFPSNNSLAMVVYCLNPLQTKFREMSGSLLKIHIQGQAAVITGGRMTMVRGPG